MVSRINVYLFRFQMLVELDNGYLPLIRRKPEVEESNTLDLKPFAQNISSKV